MSSHEDQLCETWTTLFHCRNILILPYVLLDKPTHLTDLYPFIIMYIYIYMWIEKKHSEEFDSIVCWDI